MVRHLALFDETAYDSVLINGMVLGGDGRKMSKHLGNVLEPIPLMEHHGADGVRWIDTDAEGRLRVDKLREQIAADREAGRLPFLVVATAGSVSTIRRSHPCASSTYARRAARWTRQCRGCAQDRPTAHRHCAAHPRPARADRRR